MTCKITNDATGEVIAEAATSTECDAWFEDNDPGYDTHTHSRVPASTTGSEKPLHRDGHACPCPHPAGHPACACGSPEPTGSEQ